MPYSQHQPPICPSCKKPKTLELQPGGKSPRTFQCLDCDRPDPIASSVAQGWLKGELAPKE